MRKLDSGQRNNFPDAKHGLQVVIQSQNGNSAALPPFYQDGNEHPKRNGHPNWATLELLLTLTTKRLKSLGYHS